MSGITILVGTFSLHNEWNNWTKHTTHTSAGWGMEPVKTLCRGSKAPAGGA